MAIVLTKDFETGIDKIDRQHQELVKKLNDIIDMGASSVTKEETERTLGFLAEYVVKHFSDEEKLQQQYNYPKYEWHKEQHKSFIVSLTDMKDEYRRNGASAKYTLDLNAVIVQWLVRHIKSVDVELGKYIRSVK